MEITVEVGSRFGGHKIVHIPVKEIMETRKSLKLKKFMKFSKSMKGETK